MIERFAHFERWAGWVVVLFAVGLAVAMLLQDDLRSARMVAFAVLTVMLVGFVAAYGLGSPWRATTEGKALFAYMVSLMVICLQSTIALFLGSDYPGRELLSAVSLYAVALTAATMFWLLVRQQYRQRREVRRLMRKRDELQRQEAECKRASGEPPQSS